MPGPRQAILRSLTRCSGLMLLLALSMLFETAAAQPTPRSYVNIAYVPTVGKVLVFGGQLRNVSPIPHDESIWWWDPADGSWSQVATDGAPSSRSGAAIAVHEPTGTVLVYGGSVVAGSGAGPRLTPETWLFFPDEERWEQLEFAASDTPMPGLGEALTYDPVSDTFVLYGGLSFPGLRAYDQTWQFDLDERAWTRVSAPSYPEATNFIALASDPASGLLVMYGTTDFNAWVFDPAAATWERRAKGQEGRREDVYSKIVFDHDSGKLVRYGGTGEHADRPWIYDVASDSWQELAVEGPAPTKRSRHGMSSVPGLGVVVFGGQALPDGFETDELWVLDVNAGRWTQR